MSLYYLLLSGMIYTCLLTGCAAQQGETPKSDAANQRVRIDSIDIIPSPINISNDFSVTVKLVLAPGLKISVDTSEPISTTANSGINGLKLENATATSAVILERDEDEPQTVSFRRSFRLDGRIDRGVRELVVYVTCQVCSFDICYPSVELVQRKQVRIVRPN